MRRIPRLALLLLCAICYPAAAYNFKPTAAEWSAWPPYCKAKYAVTFVGRDSQFQGRIPQSEIVKWEQRLGQLVWGHIHHGCAGMAWVKRAERTRDPRERQLAAKAAIGESNYVMKYLTSDNFMYAKLSSVVARANDAVGNKTKARDEMEKLIAVQPDNPELYTVLAKFYYDDKRFTDARDLLTRGIGIAEQPSAEMQYFLGLVEFKLGDYAAAAAAAREAARLGYPLQGLKRKLVRAGHWKKE